MIEGNVAKVNCDFCGKQIECPEDMLNSEKHACSECYFKKGEEISKGSSGKLHVDIANEDIGELLPRVMVEKIVEGVFPELWNENKEELKAMSKKELAEEMFAGGAFLAINSMMQMSEKTRKTKNADKGKK